MWDLPIHKYINTIDTTDVSFQVLAKMQKHVDLIMGFQSTTGILFDSSFSHFFIHSSFF